MQIALIIYGSLDEVSKRNRNATRPVTAMLNYGLAVLESQVRLAVIVAGLDPAIGYTHAQHEGRSALVFT